jgi:hypothetical protein
VGKVAELLVSPGQMQAKYLDVVVDEKELELEPVDRHVLLPAERVRLEAGAKRVVVGGLLADDLGGYPQYGGLPLRHGDARGLEDVFDRMVGRTPPARDPYDAPASPESGFYGRSDGRPLTARED